MNRRVLLAWELGGGRGHAFIAGWLARALKRRGYEPVLAVQQLLALQSIESELGDIPYVQAPVWPTAHHRPHPSQNVTLGDALADAGLRSASAVRYMIGAWDQLLKLIQPAAVIADYAPGMLLAARGRLPVVAIGEGFTLPPSTLRMFPSLIDGVDQPRCREDETLEVLNTVLRETSRSQLAYLPEIFSADRSCTAAFAEFDAYRHFREAPNAGPWMPSWDRSVSREGQEIFCYFSLPTPFEATIVRALAELARRGIPVRVHMPHLTADALALLQEIGVSAERTALPFGEIQRRSRLVASLGSLSFIACALVAGIPQIAFPLGITRDLVSGGISQIGIGRALTVDPESPLEPALLAQAFTEAYESEEFQARAREVAPEFARRLEPRPDELVARYVEELVGPA